MGYKVSDGKTFDAAAPAGQVINDYDLYRIAGWNGVAIGQKDAVQTDRTLSFECDPPAQYSILLPAGVVPVVGQVLYWTTFDNTTFQRGDTHLAVAVVGQPAVKVLKVKNAAGYAVCRVLNNG